MSKKVKTQRQKAKKARGEPPLRGVTPPPPVPGMYLPPGMYGARGIFLEETPPARPRLPEPEAADFTNNQRTVEFLQRCMEAAFEQFIWEHRTHALQVKMEVTAREILEQAIRAQLVHNDVGVFSTPDNRSIRCFFNPTAGGPRRVLEIITDHV